MNNQNGPSATVIKVQTFVPEEKTQMKKNNEKEINHERRLNIFSKQKIESHQRKTNSHPAYQEIQSKNRKQAVKDAKIAVFMLGNFLLDNNVDIKITHRKTEILPLQAGESGYGSRDILYNIWFTEQGNEPNFGTDNLDKAYILAEKSHGYTLARLIIPSNNQEYPNPLIISGKAICSADEDYNGHIGAFFALIDALGIFSRMKENWLQNHPLKNLFFLALSFFQITNHLNLPSHYQDNLFFKEILHEHSA